MIMNKSLIAYSCWLKYIHFKLFEGLGRDALAYWDTAQKYLFGAC